MDRRDFVLYPKRSRRWIIAVSLLFAVQVGFVIWLFWLDRSFYVWLPILMQAFFATMAAFSPSRTDKLEVSDEGLFLTRRRGIGYLLRWDAVTSVRLHEHSTAARLWSAIIEDSNGRVVKVPRACQDKAEIVEILKQRLPEGVFQAW